MGDRMSTKKSTKAAGSAKKSSKKEADIETKAAETKAAETKIHYVRFETLKEHKSDPDKLIGAWRETEEEACAAKKADRVLLHSTVVRVCYVKHCDDHDDDEPGLWSYEHTGKLKAASK